ncbi:MAG TPA: hypothetical protein VK841_14175 [Polyangiaceae bacterium]|jgi:hypothetical protein|nr:hypothetical protein [Polyangiaceae bacterium]
MFYDAMNRFLASAIVLVMAFSGVALSVGCGDASASSPPPATPTAAATNSAAPSASPAAPAAPASGGW